LTGRASADPTYIMGHSAEERERLIQQAGFFGPITARFLHTAGIGPSMRVLDVGCGVGDVTLLCADLVGPEGAVVGVDRDPAALGRGRERMQSAARSPSTPSPTGCAPRLWAAAACSPCR
jgi:SAM-dependent methyltransferase